jgi:DNA-binding transcriptional LysR family regulator
VEVDVDDAASAVASGRVDVAFGVDYPQSPIPRAAGVSMAVVATERFALALPAADHRAGTVASLAEFADGRWILPPERTSYGRAIRMACRRAGFEPLVEHVVTDTASTLALVAAGLGIAPVTDLMLRLRGDGLATASLHETVERTMVLAYRVAPSPQPGVAAVVDAITRAASDRRVRSNGPQESRGRAATTGA